MGDGEAETGPLATSWHSNKFLNPARDGAVLPVLHLNGYKIANPTVLARIPHEELRSLLEGYGYAPRFVEGDDPATMHRLMATTLEQATSEIAAIQRDARAGRARERPRWPMIVLRTPKGWTGPKTVDGLPSEGSFRSHQVPLADLAAKPEHLAQLEAWMRSYRPEELFEQSGALRADLAALAPAGDRRMGANPHANGGLLLRELELPDFRAYAVEVRSPTGSVSEPTRVLGAFLRDVIERNPENFRLLGPDETASNRLGAVFETTDRAWEAELRAERRSPRARRAGDGGALGAPLRGLARGLPADGPPRPVQQLRGVRPHRRLDVQPARQVAEGEPRDPLAPADRLAELPAVLARVAPGQQRLLPSGPGLHRPRAQQEGADRARVPAAGRQLPAVRRRSLPAQPRLRQRDRRRQAAIAELPLDGGRARPLRPRARDLGVGFSSDGADEPDVVLACAGDIPTLETVAATALLRERLPELKVRVVNVVDVMRLEPESEHPHGLPDAEFDALFTRERPVVFAYHGYPWLIHRLTYRRANHANIHVRGYKEEGTTTTPFDMVMLNDLDRFHLVMDVIDRVPGLAERAAHVRQEMADERLRHRAYTREHGEDPRELTEWRWPSFDPDASTPAALG